jgi:hypothetical protein
MQNVTHPQPSANGAVNGTATHNNTSTTPDKLERPDRLNLHVLWERLEWLHEDLQATKREGPRSQDAPTFKVILAVVAGCTPPVLALAMSTVTGTVAGAGGATARFALLPATVLVCMLIVSTPHVNEAKRQLGWSSWQAWSFAAGLDCAIVVSELLAVWCHSELASVWWLPKLVIVASVGYSATLNSYVNLLHAGWSRVTDPRKR